MIASKLNPWVSFVMGNAILHFGWVSVLTICQTYQVVWLGMTTNERMNRGRYRHFQALGGKSPFSRGPIKNTADFLECGCFGLVEPITTDWMTHFDMKMCIEREPLLRAPTDNYQYVWSETSFSKLLVNLKRRTFDVKCETFLAFDLKKTKTKMV